MTRRPIAAVIPTPNGNASVATRLALRLRTEATKSGWCACGAVAEMFEVTPSGLRPVDAEGAAAVIERAGVLSIRFLHEPDCPAGHDLPADEVHDPVSALFHARER